MIRSNKLSLIPIILLLLITLLGCTVIPQDTPVMLKPTPLSSQTPLSAPTLSAAPTDDTDVYVDFAHAVPAQHVPLLWDRRTFTIDKYMLTIPSTNPITLAQGLDGMNAVLYVGTDEQGYQYIAIFDTESLESKIVYTAEEGMSITSLAQNGIKDHYDKRYAYSWVETDGDFWRIRDNLIASNADYHTSDASIVAEGSISKGSSFIPQYDEDIRQKDKSLALVSPSGDESAPYLHRIGLPHIILEFPLEITDHKALWTIEPSQFIHTAHSATENLFVFHDLYQRSCTTEPFGMFSYRFPEGEILESIISANNSMGNIDLCVSTSKRNCYGFTTYDEIPYLIQSNVRQAISSRIGYTFLITDEPGKLYTWNCITGVIDLFGPDVEPTGLAEGYTGRDVSDPYEVYVFAKEADHMCLFRIKLKGYTQEES